MARRNRKLLYWDWIRVEAARINSDGCTLVSECYHDCCLEHDLAYYHGRNPYHAYKLYTTHIPDYWDKAEHVSRWVADTSFRNCIQKKSPIGLWSPMSWLRWVGVLLGGYYPWRSHRARR